MKKIIFLLLSPVLTFSCRKNDPPVVPVVPETIYISGAITNTPANYSYGCYWKNGTAVPLTTIVASGMIESTNDMVLYNNDVYVAGVEELPSGRGIGKYWKNGALVSTFDNGVDNIVCNAIAVNASGVHIAITEQSNSGVYTPKYWKNGTIISLPLSGSVPNALLEDITLSGNDVYILGTQVTGVNRNCILWKNGLPTIIPLTNPVGASYFRLFVSGNDVYICTTEYIPGSNKSRVMLYKNNDAPVAITHTNSASARDIFVKGSDVYIAGFQFETDGTLKGCYWKNGVKFIMDAGGPNANGEISGIYVLNNDVYACGITYINNNATATYWKNGVLKALGNGTLSSETNKIIVQ